MKAIALCIQQLTCSALAVLDFVFELPHGFALDTAVRLSPALGTAFVQCLLHSRSYNSRTGLPSPPKLSSRLIQEKFRKLSIYLSESEEEWRYCFCPALMKCEKHYFAKWVFQFSRLWTIWSSCYLCWCYSSQCRDGNKCCHHLLYYPLHWQ